MTTALSVERSLPASGLSARDIGRSIRTALICMPFCTAQWPSIQVGLLTAIGRQAGFEVDPYHLNLELAVRIPEEYEALCNHRGQMTGEWLFSLAAFGDEVDIDDNAYFAQFPEELEWAAQGGRDARFLSRMRHEVIPRYVEDCVAGAEWGKYEVIGFTSTFQQNVATLALAKRIRERFPDICLIVGGANMEGEMGLEYARAFPFIDHVVIGEGDVAFPEILKRLEDGQSPAGIPGVTWRNASDVHFTETEAPFRNLDSLPTPVYDDFFRRRKELGLHYGKGDLPVIPFESSRGCWWGQKHHCTFCGLNGGNMAFRAKTPARVLAELSELADRHRVTMFHAADNIVDMKYLNTFFAEIASAKTDFNFFYETKANLTQEQIRAMYLGGVRWLQPGIESMSSRVLQLMRKGCSMLQNIRTLKWCRYYRIRVGWNLLRGFPGEREEDYRQEYEVLKLLTHLQPPTGGGKIWMERFSPIFFDRENFKLKWRSPKYSYSFVYPRDIDTEKAAYFFDYEFEDTLADETHSATDALLKEWRKTWEEGGQPVLLYRRTLDAIIVDDSRDVANQGSHLFTGPAAKIFDFCSETMRSPVQVARYLAETHSGKFDEEEVRSTLNEFCQRSLMVSENDNYLNLAVPTNPNW
jgi:ribosomal peptide maturation radical SAM protein 1